MQAMAAARIGTPVRGISAPRGVALTCKGWPQEAAYRMLQNNLDPEVAENPDALVVYGGTGRAARSWDAYRSMLQTLTTLEDDETMLVQSGKPVGVLRTHEWAPRVLIANSNLVPDWAEWDEFRRLEHLGLTMYGQMTAGSWIYIGTQGILQGTYECFAAIARKRFGGSLSGTLTLTAGAGGMGGAQPLAVTMNGGAVLIVDVDPHMLQRRVEHRYLDEIAPDYETAVRRVTAARQNDEARSVGLVGNAADILPRLLDDGVEADTHTLVACWETLPAEPQLQTAIETALVELVETHAPIAVSWLQGGCDPEEHLVFEVESSPSGQLGIWRVSPSIVTVNLAALPDEPEAWTNQIERYMGQIAREVLLDLPDWADQRRHRILYGRRPRSDPHALRMATARSRARARCCGRSRHRRAMGHLRGGRRVRLGRSCLGREGRCRRSHRHRHERAGQRVDGLRRPLAEALRWDEVAERPRRGWAVGLVGELLRWDGAAWVQEQPSGFASVDINWSGTVVAAKANGEVVRISPQGMVEELPGGHALHVSIDFDGRITMVDASDGFRPERWDDASGTWQPDEGPGGGTRDDRGRTQPLVLRHHGRWARRLVRGSRAPAGCRCVGHRCRPHGVARHVDHRRPRRPRPTQRELDALSTLLGRRCARGRFSASTSAPTVARPRCAQGAWRSSASTAASGRWSRRPRCPGAFRRTSASPRRPGHIVVPLSPGGDFVETIRAFDPWTGAWSLPVGIYFPPLLSFDAQTPTLHIAAGLAPSGKYLEASGPDLLCQLLLTLVASSTT